MKNANKQTKRNKHNVELQRTDPDTKDAGKFNAKDHIFPCKAIFLKLPPLDHWASRMK